MDLGYQSPQSEIAEGSLLRELVHLYYAIFYKDGEAMNLDFSSKTRALLAASGMSLVLGIFAAFPTSCFAANIDPLRYGAKGDGVHDDWAALVQAFTAAVSDPSHTVQIDSGYNFAFSGQLTVPAHVTVVGNGPNCRLTALGITTPLLLSSYSELANLRLMGPGADKFSSGDGISIGALNASNITIQSVTLDSSCPNTIAFQSVSNSTLNGVTFSNISYLKNGSVVEVGVEFISCNNINLSYSLLPALLDLNSSNINVSYNQIGMSSGANHSTYGIFVEGGTNHTFSTNTISHCSSFGTVLSDYFSGVTSSALSHVTVSYNTFSNNGEDVVVQSSVPTAPISNLNVTTNTFSNTTSIAVRTQALPGCPISVLTVTNNTIQGPGLSAIALQGCASAWVELNTISNTGESAICVVDDLGAVTVYNNKIASTGLSFSPNIQSQFGPDPAVIDIFNDGTIALLSTSSVNVSNNQYTGALNGNKYAVAAVGMPHITVSANQMEMLPNKL